jgi:hypothetical protein
VSERIDHRSIEAQHNEALEHAAITWMQKKKHYGLPRQQQPAARQCNVFIVPSGTVEEFRKNVLLNRLYAMR